MPVGDTSSLLIPTQFFSGAGGPSLVAVIWQRFGPYHLARLRGAAGELEPHGWRVVGLEVAERDHYGWSIVRDPAVVQRTLFPSAVYSSLSSRQIKAQVRRALSVL